MRGLPHSDESKVSWVIDGFVPSKAVVVMTFVTEFDLMGRKPIVQLGETYRS